MQRLQARRDAALDTLVRGRHVCFVAAAMIGSAAIGAMASSDQASAASDAAQRGYQASENQLDFAKKQYGDWQARYSPLEQQLVDQAGHAGGVGEQNMMAGRAAADTNAGYANSLGQMTRNASRFGINPNSGNFQDQLRQNAIAQGSALAGGMQNARFQDWQSGRAFKLDVANHGMGLASNALGAMGSAAYGLNNAARTNYGMANGIQKGIGDLGNGVYQAGKQAGWWGDGGQGAAGGNGEWMMGSNSGRGFAPMGAGASDPTFGTGTMDSGSFSAPALNYSMSDAGGGNGFLMENHGGAIHGPGTHTSDSIPARLSDGEYVLNAEAVQLAGKHNLDALNNRGLQVRAQHQPLRVGAPGQQQTLDPRLLMANKQRLAAAQGHFAQGGLVGDNNPSFPQLMGDYEHPGELSGEQQTQYNAWLNANGIPDSTEHDLKGFWAAHAPNPTGQPGVNNFQYPGRTQGFASGGLVATQMPEQAGHPGHTPPGLGWGTRLSPEQEQQYEALMQASGQFEQPGVDSRGQYAQMLAPYAQVQGQVPGFAVGGLVDSGGNAFTPPGYDMSQAPAGQGQPVQPPMGQPPMQPPMGPPMGQPQPPQGLTPMPAPQPPARKARKGKSRAKAPAKKGAKK